MSEELAVTSDIIEELKRSEPTEVRQELVKQANSACGILSSIPMVCHLEKCPYSEVCPILQKGLVEEGERCPIETDLVRNMFIAYCQELSINPDIDKVQAGLIKDLCSVEIQAMRANKLMSYQDFLVNAVDAVNNRTGEVYYKKDLHIAVTWSERLLNQKMRILDALAATPLVKAKYLGGAKVDTLLDRMSALKERVDAISPTDDEEESTYDIEDWRE